MNLQDRKAHIDKCLNEGKKPMREWVAEYLAANGPVNISESLYEHYYPDSKPISEWHALHVLSNWTGSVEVSGDPLDAPSVEAELTLIAKVKVTASIRVALMEQYEWSAEDAWDDEKVASAMLYASINPLIPYDNTGSDDFWDGVANMKGHILRIKLEDGE